MKTSCGTWFVLYLLFAAAAGAIVYRRFPVTEAAIGAGVVGGGVLWLGLAYFWGIGTKVRASRMIRDALGGASPLDGEKIAAIGRIEPAGSPLVSPLSKTPCVAYKYEVRNGSGEHSWVYADGFALTPSMIQTPRGSIRLLAWPGLERVSSNVVPAQIGKANAQEYLAAVEVRQPSVMDIRQSLTDMLAMYRDDDGSVRWDQGAALRSAAPDLDNATYREWLLRPGQPVCVTGTYSVARGAIIPSTEPLVDAVTLELGAPDAFAGRAVTGGTGYFIGGTIFVAIAAVALLAFLTFIPLEASEQMAPALQVTWPELRVEQFVEKHVRVKLREMGMINAAEFVSISLPAGSAAGRIRRVEHEETVSRAVAIRNGEETTISIDSGAIALILGPQQQPQKLTLLDHDVPLDQASVQVVGRLEGRITFVSADRACHVTYHASE